MWALASYVVVPVLAYATFSPLFDQLIGAKSVATVWLGFGIAAALLRPNTAPKVQLPKSNLATPRSYTQLLILSGAILTVLLVVGYGVTELSLGFDDVYQRRFEARAQSAPFPGADYLIRWLGVPIIPLLLAVGLRRKSFVAISLAIVASLLIFSHNGAKSIIYAAPVIVALYWSLTRRNKDNAPWWGIVVTGTIALPLLFDLLLSSSSGSYLVTRRLGLSPAVLTNHYVEYTDGSGHSYFTQHVFKWLIPSADRESPGFVIGEYLRSESQSNANANLWADGYFSWGFLGVIIISLAFVVVMRFADKLAMSRDFVVATVAIGATFATLTDGYLPTFLVTGGGLLVLLLIWFMPKSLTDKDESKLADAGLSGSAESNADLNRPAASDRGG
jgi:hypothetical protein